MCLENAIRAGEALSVLDLLRSGVDTNSRGPEGLTPLMVASGLGAFHLAQLLLTAGADVHAIEPRMGTTALHKAAQAGSPDVVDLLLDQGAFIDQQSPVLGNTPLIDAVLHRHEAVIARLLHRGARTPIANHWHQTALDIARADGLEAIERQIEAHDRANADRVASLALFAAAKRGDLAAVERLIAQGQPLDEQVPQIGTTDDNYTPLGVAAREGRVDVVGALLDAGADPQRLIGLMGGMALHDATYFGHAHVVRLLTMNIGGSTGAVPGLDVQGAYNGLTALHDAVWQGHPEVVRALVEAGARTDLRSHTGMTPRDLSQLYGHPEIAELLVKAEQARSTASQNDAPPTEALRD